MTQAHESRLAGALLVLTAATGLIDAVSYLALGHVFTANMTCTARSHDHRPHVDPHGARGGFATRGRYQSAGVAACGICPEHVLGGRGRRAPGPAFTGAAAGSERRRVMRLCHHADAPRRGCRTVSSRVEQWCIAGLE